MFSFSHIAVVGSRRPSSVVAASVSLFSYYLHSFLGVISVGCATGVDAIVRGALPGAQVFEAALPASVPSAGASRTAVAAALVARSVAVVRSLPVLGSGAVFAFPLGACPAGLLPSRSSARCFAGFGSGSWAAVALAAGIGHSVFVFCPEAGASLPRHWSGTWAAVSVGGVQFWHFVPAQASLF